MKKILIWIVILAIAYFIIGYIAVLLGWFNKDSYLTFSAIIGSIASVSGLLAFTSNKIEKDDIERVGVEYFKKVVESAEELKEKEEKLHSKEQALTAKEKEIEELGIKKKEMEYLVRKASMSLFLKDQLERTEGRIVEITNENKELNNLLHKRKTIIQQLDEVEEEIKTSPDVDLIREIIESTKSKLYRNRKREPKSLIELFLVVGEEFTSLLLGPKR